MRALGGARGEKLGYPHPRAQVGTEAKQERGVLPCKPLENLERRAGVGPRLRVADRDLPAVGEARLGGRGGLPVDNGYLMAEAAEVVAKDIMRARAATSAILMKQHDRAPA